MLFTVNQSASGIELIFEDSDKYINVYPAYHQIGDLNYKNVNAADWSASGSRYVWDTTLPTINSDTVPVIQLVYSYDATEMQKQQQLAAFRTITAVETTSGHLKLFTPIRPTTNFRIRFNVLNRRDLAIALNRPVGVGLGYVAERDRLLAVMTGVNLISGQSVQLSSSIPMATEQKAGILPGGLLARILKLESSYNESLEQPYKIKGYTSDLATDPVSTYYPTISALQSVNPSTWYQDCAIYSMTDTWDFTTAAHLFYQQRAVVLDITHVYTGNVRTFSYALADNSMLQNIKGLSLLDTHNATDISYMFSDDTSLTSLDLSAWDVGNVVNIEGLFKNCLSLALLDIRNFDFTKLVNGVMLIEQSDIFTGIPDDCVIWVGGEQQRNAILAEYPNLTGITYN